MRKGLTLAVAGIVALMSAATMTSSAATPNGPHTVQDFAQRILTTNHAYLTANARLAVAMMARGDNRLAPGSQPDVTQGVRAGHGGGSQSGGGLTNVRVNDPNEDQFVDQTTQSETSVAVAGQNVAVGFNDSQRALIALTGGGDITGYAYSSNSGQTWTDGGVLPDAPGTVNIGDPWLASDGTNMYFANLAIDPLGVGLGVRVSKSTDGGKSWSSPVNAATQPGLMPGGESADKDAIAVSGSNVYAAWDDFFTDTSFNFGTGLVFSKSTDGGQSFSAMYVDRFSPGTQPGCSFSQYIGAMPFVSGSTIYLAAERLYVDDPNCVFPPLQAEEDIFRSSDGGTTWGPRTTISQVGMTNGLLLGPGQIMRSIEFPTLAQVNSTLYVAWNDTSNGGNSHIRLAQSTDGGATWSTSWVTSGTGDEVQPAASSDSGHLHIAYYQRNADNTLDVMVSDSHDHGAFRTQRVTSQSFPGVETVPNFDPIIVWGYMGDYIANVSDGTSQYFAWGDNRDTVTNVLWPSGRHDPNVYFAKR